MNVFCVDVVLEVDEGFVMGFGVSIFWCVDYVVGLGIGGCGFWCGVYIVVGVCFVGGICVGFEGFGDEGCCIVGVVVGVD